MACFLVEEEELLISNIDRSVALRSFVPGARKKSRFSSQPILEIVRIEIQIYFGFFFPRC